METLEMKNTDVEKGFSFQIPTEVTRLEPVFIFNILNLEQSENNDITLNVTLNPKLSGLLERNKVVNFKFDANGMCRFNHETIQDYFIEGEIKLINQHNLIPNIAKSCFVSITYGNKDAALHFIKGKFDLHNNVFI
jgi:hypothetical protein